MQNTTTSRIDTNPIGIPALSNQQQQQHRTPSQVPILNQNNRGIKASPTDIFYPSSVTSQNQNLQNSPVNFSPQANPPSFMNAYSKKNIENNYIKDSKVSNLTKELSQGSRFDHPQHNPQELSSSYNQQHSFSSSISHSHSNSFSNVFPNSFSNHQQQPVSNSFTNSQGNNLNFPNSYSEMHSQYLPSNHNTPTIISTSYTNNPPASSSPHPSQAHSSFTNYKPTSSFPSSNINTSSIFNNSSSLPRINNFDNYSGSFNNSVGNLNFMNSNSFEDNSILNTNELTYQQFLKTLDPNEEHLNILEYPVQDLILMLSSLLTKIIESNDKLHPNHFHNSMNQLQNSSSASNNNVNNGTGKGNGINDDNETNDYERRTVEEMEMSDEQNRLKNKYLANVLAFHGKNVPGISLHSYLTRILKYCPVTTEVFLSLLVYFDRIAKKSNINNNSNVSSTSASSTNESGKEELFVMDSYNIHRLIISGITISSKFFSDIFYKNLRYAKVGGLPLEELNYLEIQFLLLLDFKLLINLSELQKYADLLLKYWKREVSKNESNDHV